MTRFAKPQLTQLLRGHGLGRNLSRSATAARLGKREEVEKLWREFFSDPSQWWDNRLEKVNDRYPDFKHKQTEQALWLDGKCKPTWVEAELTTISPSSLQSHPFAWNQRLTRCVKDGQYEKAIEVFYQLQEAGVKPNTHSYVPVLNACSKLQALEEGRTIHAQITKSGCDVDVFVGSCLVDMYGKCGSIEDAERVFHKMPARDVVAWNAMIRGYVKCGEGWKALELFWKMQDEGLEPDTVTFVGVLNACAFVFSLDEGQRVHEQVISRGFESNIFVGSCLVDMYSKCGSIEKAWSVFQKMPERNVVAWSAMIMGYVSCGQGLKALELSWQMQQEGVEPDAITFVGVLNACASLGALEEGKHIHEQITKSEYEPDIFVGTCLVDMYLKCGSLEDAWRVFEKMPSRNVVTWNAIILGHVKCGQAQMAFELFQQMHQNGIEPDRVTFLGLLNACTSIVALEAGQRVHQLIIERNFESNVFVGNTLVDMYAKCGSIEDARAVFNKMMPSHNVVSWNAMIGGYAMHGNAKEALALFKEMCHEDIEMNGATFVCLLSACNHGGLVDEGLHFFECMSSVYGISPTVQHYACVVDLLGRSGRLHEVDNLIKMMEGCEPSTMVWASLVHACRVHGNMEMGKDIAKHILELDSGNALGYIQLSSMYAASGASDKSANLQQQTLLRDVESHPGCAWIEVNNVKHSFMKDNLQHPQIQEVLVELNRMFGQIKEAGCVPDNSYFSHYVTDKVEDYDSCSHSEKLAIAFGLISTPPATPLRIFTNLRVCDNCHSATKFIAKTVGRAIILRDATRFHHFEDGSCSCKDYW